MLFPLSRRSLVDAVQRKSQNCNNAKGAAFLPLFLRNEILDWVDDGPHRGALAA
jgi:hypothetical protein